MSYQKVLFDEFVAHNILTQRSLSEDERKIVTDYADALRSVRNYLERKNITQNKVCVYIYFIIIIIIMSLL